MKKGECKNNPLTWLMAIVLAALIAGCGGGGTETPGVSATTPENLSTGVAVSANITATFSKAMDAATITDTTFTLKRGITVVPGVVSYAGTTATYNPTGDLALSTTYTATLTTAVKDVAGNALAVTKTWSFITVADTAPPSVTATVPADGATGAALNANITATFNKAVDPLTVTDTTYTLMQGVTPVAGVVTASSTTTATFNPDANLLASTVYTASITTGVKDMAGTAMPVTKTWSFTTGTTIAAGTAPVDLGTAANYAVLAKTGISTVPTSVITGNVGVSPVARVGLTGWSLITEPTDTAFTSAQVFAPGRLFAADNVGGTTSADLGTAVLDMGTAYTDAAGRTATSAATTNVGAGTLTGLTLAPGVYEWGSAVTIPTDLTLNGTATDVWIFKVAGTLDMAAAKNVILSGGALPQNVFWQVSGAVTIGTNAHFEGVILGQTSITFRNLSSINGRLLAQTAVVLDATTVTQP